MTGTTQNNPPPAGQSAETDAEFQQLLRQGREVFASWARHDSSTHDLEAQTKASHDQHDDEDDHERNFRLMRILRRIAVIFNNKSALNEIEKAARAKRRWDLVGKVWAVIYGLASGACIAGFVVLTAGMGHFKAQPLYALALAVPLWCSTRANWWLVRRDPADMLFHWNYAPKAEEHISRKKRFMAMFSALLDALLIAGLTAYGAWSFMGAVGLNPVTSIVITSLFFAATFIPELSLNFNNNKALLEKGWGKFQAFKAKITQGDNPAYLRKFWVYFGCALIGMIFSAFATLPVAAQFGVPTFASLPLLTLVTVCGIGFYFNKAKEQVLREFNADQAASKANESGKAQASDPEHDKRYTVEFVVNRWMNAIGHALISFLGVFEVANYFGWIHMGERSFTMSHLIGVMEPSAAVILVTIAAVSIFAMGIVASYIGNASGKQNGYEDQIDALLPVQQSALLAPSGRNESEPPKLAPEGKLTLLSRQDFVSGSRDTFNEMAYEIAGKKYVQSGM